MKKILFLMITAFVCLFAQSADEIRSEMQLEMLNLPEIVEDSSAVDLPIDEAVDSLELPAGPPSAPEPSQSLFPLELDTAVIGRSIIGLEWGLSRNRIHDILVNSDVVQTGEDNYLYILNKDSLLLAIGYEDGRFSSISLTFRFQGIDEGDRRESFKAFQEWCFDKLGRPDKMQLRDFDPLLSDSPEQPGELYNWHFGSEVEAGLSYNFQKDPGMILAFKYLEQEKQKSVREKLKNFFK